MNQDIYSSVHYKRIINEYCLLNKQFIYNNNKYAFSEFTYKIHTINSYNIKFKSEVTILYKSKKYNINLFYDINYPFHYPCKIELNNINIVDEYKKIMSKNNDLFNKQNQDLCCNSILVNNNKWHCRYTINEILTEIIKVIDYKDLHIKRILLNKICNKYTNQSLDYLHHYLL